MNPSAPAHRISAPFILLGMILAVALTRLLPHPPNFSPVEAMALFGGAYFSKRAWAVWAPLLALFVSDLALGLLMGGEYFSYFVSAGFWLVYATVALLSVLGFGLRGRVSAMRVGGFGLLGATIFFMVTNFGVWYGSAFYPQSAAGLAAAYTAGLPFFQNGILGTLFYALVLFGSYALIKQRAPGLVQPNA
jgi:hypothetical protein